MLLAEWWLCQDVSNGSILRSEELEGHQMKAADGSVA